MPRSQPPRPEFGSHDVDTGVVTLLPDPVDPGAVILEVNGVPSSHVVLENPLALSFEYMDWMARIADVTLPPGRTSALHIGAAACTLPRYFAATRPDSRQLAIDVDARLLTLVREWFALPRSPELRLRPGDGAEVIAELPDGRFDLVIRDAFAGDATPEAMSGAAFFAQAARVTRKLFLANIADAPPQERSRVELRLLAEHFPHVLVAADPGQLRGRRRGNIVAAASHEPLDVVAVAKALRSGPAQARVLGGREFAAFLAG